MTFTSHHGFKNTLKSWYRPIDLKTAAEAHFTLATFSNPKDRNKLLLKKMGYYIKQPKVLPRKAEIEDYELVRKILRRGDLYLNPSPQEYQNLLRCFDWYLVDSDKLFVLFPITSVIASSNKRVHNTVVTLMIGDALDSALWIAKREKYDLLYGWCGSEITEERITAIRGHITVSSTFLEFYNTKTPIPNEGLMVHIF